MVISWAVPKPRSGQCSRILPIQTRLYFMDPSFLANPQRHPQPPQKQTYLQEFHQIDLAILVQIYFVQQVVKQTLVDLLLALLKEIQLHIRSLCQDKRSTYAEMTSQVVNGNVAFLVLVQSVETINGFRLLVFRQVQWCVFHSTLLGHFAHFIVDKLLGYGQLSLQ